MTPCDGCGREYDDLTTVETPDGSVAYVCTECNDMLQDDPDSVF